jgi:chemotaxis protein methyltransferase CheR
MTGPRRQAGPGHDLQRFQALLREVSGLELPEARRPDLQRAVDRALAATGLADADALHRHLREPAGRPALEAFVGDLTIGETHFFRNRPQFQALERHILPELIERRRGSRRLRLWSAACSTGEEPYSLAIVLERLLPDRASWDVRILATDINRSALERARRGRYGAWSFREVPDDITSTFFVRRGATLEVTGRVRQAVSFAHLNLAGDHWPSAATHTLDLDLVLCRNVLIYFGEELSHQVADRLHGALTAGGWLLVAPAELSQTVFRRFAVANLDGAIAYRKPAPVPAPAPVRAPAATRGRAQNPGMPEPHRPDGGAPAREGSPRREGVRTAVHTPQAGPDEIERAVDEWRSGRAAEALRRLEAVAEADPADGRAPLLAARIHLDRLELDRAERWAGLACQRTPLSAPAHYLRGLALQEAGRLEDALAALRRSVFLDPGSVLGQVALADLLVRLGELGRARGALRAAAALVADGDPAEPVDGHDGPPTGRVRDLIAAHLARLDGDPEAAR